MKTLLTFALIIMSFLALDVFSQSISNEKALSNYYKTLTSQAPSLLKPEDNSPQNIHLLEHFIENEMAEVVNQSFDDLFNNARTLQQLQNSLQTGYNSLTSSAAFYPNFLAYVNKQLSHADLRGEAEGEDVICENSGFDLGDYSNWFLSTGDECDAYAGCYTGEVIGLATDPVIENANHFITPGGYINDPKLATYGVILPTVCPFPGFGATSFKLGDDITNDWDASRAYYEFTVDATKPIYSYAFAVLLEDPTGGGAHSAGGKPYFSIEFTDEDGDPIPGGCASYFVESGANPGFISVPGAPRALQYKDWTRLDVDLNAYIGQDIRVEYRVSDCDLGGHRGYAYIDAICDLPEISIEHDCNGIKLAAPEGYFGYEWSTGELTREIVVPGPGLYSVDLISENGCRITIDTMVNKIYVKLDQDAVVVDASCFGYANGSITVNAFGGTVPYQYSINGGATFQASNSFNGLPAGVYNILIKDEMDCVHDKNYTINQPPTMTLAITKKESCFDACDGNVTLTPGGGNSPGGTYKIRINGSLLVGNNKTNMCPGIYDIQLKDEAGCLQNFPLTIDELPALVMPAVGIKDEDCYNDCSGRISITPAANLTYSIDNGLTFSVNNVFSNLCAQPGVYKVKVKDHNGCLAQTNAVINQPPPLEIILEDKQICLHTTVDLDANVIGGVNPITYRWSTGEATKKINVFADMDRSYFVTGTDANGCEISGNVRVSLLPQPKANFTYAPGVVDIFSNEVTFTNKSEGFTSNLWRFDDLGSSASVDEIFKFPAEGGKSYQVCLEVENDDKCRDSICKTILVKHSSLIFVPNVFTPDGDGVNDIVVPVVEGIEEENFEFLVFNRWGQLIFQTSEQGKGWNGTFKGVKAKQDAYVWKVKGVRKDNGDRVEEIGHVSLLK